MQENYKCNKSKKERNERQRDKKDRLVGNGFLVKELSSLQLLKLTEINATFKLLRLLLIYKVLSPRDTYFHIVSSK
jgi:hypothetical protein